MALKDLRNETPKEFVKKSAKMYMKDVLKGAVVVAVIILIIVAYHLFSETDGEKSGFGEYLENIEESLKKDILHIDSDTPTPIPSADAE